VGSFSTVAPSISVTFPNGGEALQRGLPVFIRWTDNIQENVEIDLYQGGTFVKAIATNAPSNGAYQWQIGLDLAPGSGYSLKISSTTNAAFSVSSTSPFSIIDAPAVNSNLAVRLPDGRLQLTVSVPGANQASILVSTNLTSWQLLQSLPLQNGNAVFADDASTNTSARFYRLRVP